jgi:hypothetical protein
MPETGRLNLQRDDSPNLATCCEQFPELGLAMLDRVRPVDVQAD